MNSKNKHAKFSDSVTYRQVTIPQLGGTALCGFALWYSTPEGAHSFRDALNRHFQEKGLAPAEISFSSQGLSSYVLDLKIPTRQYLWKTTIHDVLADHVFSLRTTLEVYPYIFVVSGYAKPGEGDYILPHCILATTRMIIDGRYIEGRSGQPYPWDIVSKITGSEPSSSLDS